MARGTRKVRQDDAERVAVTDYRHTGASRKNNPPASIAAEGLTPYIPQLRYSYSPRRAPELRFDQNGTADQLPELLAHARERALTEEETRLLADALRVHQPWLEWAGKREAKEFTVEPVALHIHERVSTQALLNVAMRQDVTRDLFADPAQEYREAVQFYQHDVDWANRLILGDSLQVMASLARREDLAGKVQMIYMDPPYGIRFGSNFQPEISKRDVKDKEQDLTREPEMVKAYRDTWQLGVHSYLSYLRDRLIVARELLTDTGSIFVQISNENLHRVRLVVDDVFGSDNSCGLITFQKTGSLTGTLLSTTVDYLLWYARDKAQVKYRQLYQHRQAGDPSLDRYDRLKHDNGLERRLNIEEIDDTSRVNAGQRYRFQSLFSDGETSKGNFEFHYNLRPFLCPRGNHWKTNLDGMLRLANAERIGIEGIRLRYKRYVDDYPVVPL